MTKTSCTCRGMIKMSPWHPACQQFLACERPGFLQIWGHQLHTLRKFLFLSDDWQSCRWELQLFCPLSVAAKFPEAKRSRWHLQNVNKREHDVTQFWPKIDPPPRTLKWVWGLMLIFPLPFSSFSVTGMTLSDSADSFSLVPKSELC